MGVAVTPPAAPTRSTGAQAATIDGRGQARRVAIIGAGALGSALGRILADAGHRVCFTSLDTRMVASAAAAAVTAGTGSAREVIEFGEIVVLSVPFESVDALAARYGGALAGKIVIDPTQPMIRTATGIEAVPRPPNITAAQLQQSRLPRSHVVTAFGHFQAPDLLRLGRYGQNGLAERAAMFFGGDDPASKTAVAHLIRDAGFAPSDLGTLTDTRTLEFDAPDFVGADPRALAAASVRLAHIGQ
ncbi:NADPH-dependent F420 reductase [Nocardia sp. NPDC055321]